MEQTTLVRIRKRLSETPTSVTLILEPIDWQLWNYHPGQFLMLKLSIEGRNYFRAYSLGSTPDLDPYPFITIKRVQEGVVSNYINDQLKKGQILEVIPPQGQFGKSIQRPVCKKHYVAIAAGSGMTPIFSLVKSILHSQPLSQVELLSTNKTADEIMYASAWRALRQQHPHRLTLIHAITQQRSAWNGLVGRLTPERVISEKLLSEKNQKEADYLLCGPKPMMDSWYNFLLNQLKLPANQIHSEDFGRVLAFKKEAIPKAVTSQSELVIQHLDGKEQTLKIEKDELLLDAALDAGVDIPYGCSTGLCNLCRVKCLEGSVTMEATDGLSEEALEAGYVLSCVARPASSRVVIALEEVD